MKNILLLCEAYGGGVKTYIDAFNKNNEQLKHVNLKILVSSKRLTAIHSDINQDYIIEDHLSFGKSIFKMMRALQTLNKVVKDNDIEIIHANSTFSGILIYLYKMLYHSKTQLMYTPHGYYSFKPMGKVKKSCIRYVEKKINHACVKVIHVSKSEEMEAIERKLIKKQKSIVVYNGVEQPNKNKRINNERFTIINLARVDAQKNPEAFVEIAKVIVEENPNIQFIWAGHGEQLEKMRAKVKKYQLQNHIQFIGHLEDKDSLLCQADLYFSTSHYEGLPFAVIEAMSYGVPLLLSNNIGHVDLIANEENGLLFHLNDINAVRTFINTMYHNPEKRMAMSHNCYKKFKGNFSQEVMLKSTEDIYLSLN